MKKIILITIGFFIITVGGVNAAGPKKEQSGLRLPPGKWWRLPRIAEDQKITPEEQTELDKLYIQNRRQLIDLKSALQKQLLELEIIFEEQDFNPNRSLKQYQKVQDARTRLALERFKFVVEVRNLLGLERFRQLESKFREFRKKYRGQKKRRFGPAGQKRQRPGMEEEMSAMD